MLKRMLACLLSLCLLYPAAVAESVTEVIFSGEQVQVKGSGAMLKKGVLTIESEGVYVLSGSGSVPVEVDAKGNVILRLNGLTVNAKDTVLNAKKNANVAIELMDGTENVLTVISGEKKADAVNVKGDLSVSGSGCLTANADHGNAVQVNGNAVVSGGVMKLESSAAALRVKENLSISGGDMTITSGADGIHAGSAAKEATETEEAEEASGSFAMSGGTVRITADGDGITSETTAVISGGALKVLAGGGSANGEVHAEEFGRGGWNQQPTVSAADEDKPSTKGIKTRNDLTISGGTVELDAADDGLHAGGNVNITGGVVILSSGDDGIHADSDVTIDDGVIDIRQSYEGIEGMHITLNGGDVSLVSSDDGVNASDGSGESFFGGFGGRGDFGGRGGMGKGNWNGQMDGRKGGRDNFDTQRMNEMPQGTPPAMPEGMTAMPDGAPAMPDAAPAMPDAAPDMVSGATQTADASDRTLPLLTINGGTLRVRADGDGLDSNGSMVINGGLILVDGPENSGNGALDAGTESGGVLSMNGGTLLAIGAVGMAETPGSTSAQPFISAAVSFRAGDEIVITDENGDTLLTHTARASGSSVIFSCAGLTEGQILTVTVGGTSVQASCGTQSSGYGGFGGFGGGHGKW